jgi:hypothetical protein
MLFGRRKPTPLPEASRMGFKSRLVLAKLGFELRQRYDALIGRELPDELGRLASKLNPSVVEWETSRYGAAASGQTIGGGDRRDSSAVAYFEAASGTIGPKFLDGFLKLGVSIAQAPKL